VTPPPFVSALPHPPVMHECHLGVLPAVLPFVWKPWLRFCVQILDLDADALMQQVTQGCGTWCHHLVVHLLVMECRAVVVVVVDARGASSSVCTSSIVVGSLGLAECQAVAARHLSAAVGPQ
jgi:hypothetical protein